MGSSEAGKAVSPQTELTPTVADNASSHERLSGGFGSTVARRLIDDQDTDATGA